MVNYIKDYIFSKPIKLYNLDYHMNKIEKNYLNQFNDKSYVFNIKKDKFVKIVKSLFSEYYDEIKNAIINNDTQLITLSSKLRKTFKKYNLAVSRCLSVFEMFSFENNQKLINQLIDSGIHRKDAILIDDCYNKSKDINEKFVFVTQDNDIIECSTNIFELLDSKIYFAKTCFIFK